MNALTQIWIILAVIVVSVILSVSIVESMEKEE